MTMFYGARDLLDITGAVSAPKRSRLRLSPRTTKAIQTAVGIGFAVSIWVTLMVLP